MAIILNLLDFWQFPLTSVFLKITIIITFLLFFVINGPIGDHLMSVYLLKFELVLHYVHFRCKEFVSEFKYFL